MKKIFLLICFTVYLSVNSFSQCKEVETLKIEIINDLNAHVINRDDSTKKIVLIQFGGYNFQLLKIQLKMTLESSQIETSIERPWEFYPELGDYACILLLKDCKLVIAYTEGKNQILFIEGPSD